MVSKPATQFMKSGPSKPTATLRYAGEKVTAPKLRRSSRRLIAGVSVSSLIACAPCFAGCSYSSLRVAQKAWPAITIPP